MYSLRTRVSGRTSKLQVKDMTGQQYLPTIFLVLLRLLERSAFARNDIRRSLMIALALTLLSEKVKLFSRRSCLENVYTKPGNHPRNPLLNFLNEPLRGLLVAIMQLSLTQHLHAVDNIRLQHCRARVSLLLVPQLDVDMITLSPSAGGR